MMSMRHTRIAMAAAALMLLLCVGASAATPADNWIEAWYSPPLAPTAVLAFGDQRIFVHQTVRQVVRLEAGGKRIRVRVTNELGRAPVKIGSVHVALSSPNAVTQPESDHVLTFGGKPDAVIPVATGTAPPAQWRG